MCGHECCRVGLCVFGSGAEQCGVTIVVDFWHSCHGLQGGIKIVLLFFAPVQRVQCSPNQHTDHIFFKITLYNSKPLKCTYPNTTLNVQRCPITTDGHLEEKSKLKMIKLTSVFRLTLHVTFSEFNTKFSSCRFKKCPKMVEPHCRNGEICTKASKQISVGLQQRKDLSENAKLQFFFNKCI